MPASHSARNAHPRHLAGRAVGVAGLGQIGGSIVRRLAQYRPAVRVYGTDRNERLRTAARRYCRWRADIAALSTACDILILALPVPAIIRSLSLLADLARERRDAHRLVVMDTGTLKCAVIKAAHRHRRLYDFVGLHPLAGGEKNGWPASRDDLFEKRRMILFPGPAPRANHMARELTSLLGAQPAQLHPATHDRWAALSIGLPHALAFAAAGLEDSRTGTSPLKGDSWASLTRVAKSDPVMVAGFLTENRKMQMRILKRFTGRLRRLTERLERGDDRGVLRLLAQWDEGSPDGS